MKAPQNSNKDFIYSIDTQNASTKENEFIVEIYPYSPKMECSGQPVKVITNFDELIDFFENEC